MKLSVIVPAYNDAENLGGQLEALADQRWAAPWEVIVADNGSTDGTIPAARRYEGRVPGLRIVSAEGRRGPSHARNAGASAAAGEMLAFCDSDDEVAPGWVAAMGEALAVHDFVASCFDTEKLNPRPAQRYLGNPQLRGLQELWYPPYMPFSGSSGLGIKRRLHLSIGGFDEDLPALEDVDYCLRHQLAGTRLHAVPRALVHVRYRRNLGGVFRQGRLWAEYNTLMYKRYRPAGARIERPWRVYAADCMRLARELKHLGSGEVRSGWVYRLGWQVGLLEGSIKYRVAPAVYGRRPRRQEEAS